MFTKYDYDELCRRTNISFAFMALRKDKDIALEKIVEFAILHYIRQCPEYSGERIFNILDSNIKPITDKIYEKFKRAYPDKKLYEVKKLDIERLFCDSKEQNNFEYENKDINN